MTDNPQYDENAQEQSVADPVGTNETTTSPATEVGDGDGENLDYLFDHLQDLNDGEVQAVFAILDELDPLEMADGAYRWTPKQRDVIGAAQTAYKEAGFGA